MKKILALIAAVGLILGVAGNAVAYFEPYSLTLSVWNTATNIETGYDLGTIDSAFLAQENITLFSDADFSDTAAGAAIYATQNHVAGQYGHYWAIARDTSPGFAMPSIWGFDSGVTSAWNTYRLAGGDLADTATTTASNPNSAFTKLGQFGDYGGLLTGVVEDWYMPRLAALATDRYVDFYLYAYPDAMNLYEYTAYDGINPITGQAAEYAAVIRLTQSGDVIINPVPVPAGVWLLGSGLLALVGIRRKKA